jgi:hypothetical protein
MSHPTTAKISVEVRVRDDKTDGERIRGGLFPKRSNKEYVELRRKGPTPGRN